MFNKTTLYQKNNKNHKLFSSGEYFKSFLNFHGGFFFWLPIGFASCAYFLSTLMLNYVIIMIGGKNLIITYATGFHSFRNFVYAT